MTCGTHRNSGQNKATGGQEIATHGRPKQQGPRESNRRSGRGRSSEERGAAALRGNVRGGKPGAASGGGGSGWSRRQAGRGMRHRQSPPCQPAHQLTCASTTDSTGSADLTCRRGGGRAGVEVEPSRRAQWLVGKRVCGRASSVQEGRGGEAVGGKETQCGWPAQAQRQTDTAKGNSNGRQQTRRQAPARSPRAQTTPPSARRTGRRRRGRWCGRGPRAPARGCRPS